MVRLTDAYLVAVGRRRITDQMDGVTPIDLLGIPMQDYVDPRFHHAHLGRQPGRRLHLGRTTARTPTHSTRTTSSRFWSRAAPVDTPQPPIGQPLTDPARRSWQQEEHPDWVQCCWWRNGLYDLTSPGLRKHRVAVLGELLPIGRRWRHREDATAYVRGGREMTLEMEEHSAGRSRAWTS